MGFELLGLGLAVSKTIGNGNGFIFSSDTLGFLIIGTGILRKTRLGNGIEILPSGPSIDLENTLNMLQISIQANRNFQGHN